MKELIGNCAACKKELFCRGGFFEGILLNGAMYCYECTKKTEENKAK